MQFANKFILYISQACKSKTTIKKSKKIKTEKDGTLLTSKSILSTSCLIKIYLLLLLLLLYIYIYIYIYII